MTPHTTLQDADDGRRSRRARKTVNYAELNDVYLPPLGPQDFVGGVAVPSAAVGTRSRGRRNDVYIQEDYLAPRVRSTSTRRRWQETEDEDDETEEEDEILEEGSGTLSLSPSGAYAISHSSKESRTGSRLPSDYRRGNLEVVTEEDDEEEEEEEEEGEIGSVKGFTPSDSIHSNSLVAAGWRHIEGVRKHSTFACMESSSDLSPVDVLVQQSLSPPAYPHRLGTPPSFQAPPTHHASNYAVHEAPPLQHTSNVPIQQRVPSLPLNDHAPPDPPMREASSFEQCAYETAATHCSQSNLLVNFSTPHLYREEGVAEGGRMGVVMLSHDSPPVANNCSTKTKHLNLLQDQ